MKHFKFITLISLAFIAFTACNKDDDGSQLLEIEAQLISNLDATAVRDFTTNPPTISGEFTKFDFSSGTITTSDTDWDIAFRGTTILVNGGEPTGINQEPSRTGNAAAYLDSSSFANVTAVTVANFKQDNATIGTAIATGGGQGWYNYDPATNTITPIGNTIVVRTTEGHFAKVQILSFYKNAPATITSEIAENDLDFYTFNYVYQPNEGVTSFE